MKAQIAEQLEYRRIESDKLSVVFAEGDLHEDAVVEKIGNVTFRQHETHLELTPAFDVVGHIDGIYDGKLLLEVKSMSKDAYTTWLDKGWDTPGLVQKYKWQVSAYMLATNLPCYFIVKCRDSGEIDDTIIPEPFYNRSEILARVLEMEVYVRKGELPDACSVSNFPCPFFYLHDEDLESWVEDETLDMLADMYEVERRAVKVAEGRQKEARKALEAGLAGREKVTTEHSKVTIYQTKRRALDVDKMKAELGEDTVEKYYVEKLGKGLRVTIKDDDESGGDTEGTGTDRGREESTGASPVSSEAHDGAPGEG